MAVSSVTGMTVMAAVGILEGHGFRWVSNDPYDARKGSVRFCTVCHVEAPCPARREAAETIRLADQMLVQYRAAALS